MTEPRIPDLPSDEELGIAGFEEELAREEAKARAARAPRPADAPPPASPDDAEAPPGRPEPRRAWRGPLTLVALLAAAYASSTARLLPPAAPMDAPDSAFSSGRAMLDLVEIARAPHPTGSPEHDRVRDFLLGRLRELGLEPEVQTATTVLRNGDEVRAATVRNVLARLPGTASTGAVLLTAHYDARGLSHGAGDDGVGVVSILETLRALRARGPLRNDLLVLLTDGEELGLMGARAFVDRHPWMEDVALVVSVEMRGAGGTSIMFETGEENGWVVGALDAARTGVYANSMATEIYRRLPNDTDFTPFRQAGVQGLNFAAIGRAPVYHQSYDTPERLDERTLQHQGRALLAMAGTLGQRDLGAVDGADRSYLRLPLLGLVDYPLAVGYGVAVGLVLAFVLALLLARRGGGGLGGVLAGFLVAAATVAAGSGTAWALFRWVRGRHGEMGALYGSAFHVEGWYVLALGAACLAVAMVLLALARGLFGLGVLAVGAALLPALAALTLTFVAPLAAVNLQGSTLLMLVGAAAVAGVGRGRRPGLLAGLVALLAAAATLAFTIPVVELVWISLSLRAAVVVGGILGLSVVLLLPALDALREPGGGWAAVLALLVGGLFLGVGLLESGPSAERPGPSTLVYALDRDAGTALWASRDDGGLSWAGARVGDLGSIQPLERWMLGDAPWRTGLAPVVDIARPTVLVVVDPSLDGRQRLNVALRSEAGAEILFVGIPTAQDVFLRRINGVDVPGEDPSQRDGARRVRTVRHQGRPDAAAGVTLELDVGAGVDSLVLDVVEHHLRPGELVGERYFLRPPSLAPDVVSGSDRAVLRTEVSVRGEVDVSRGFSPDAPPP